MPCVLQDWVCDLSYMQQSVLLTAVRGCDGLPKYHVSKYLLRWLRRCIMLSAFTKRVMTDPYEPDGGNFTGVVPKDMTLQEMFKKYLASVDEVPHHFHMHVIHAAEILAYKHPETATSNDWYRFYGNACADLHMEPESEEAMDKRLGDSRENWLAVGREEVR